METSPAPVLIRAFEFADHGGARALWERTDGLGVSQADEPAAIEAFLRRNPGLSFVALSDGRVVGTILCGHDARRGLIHHLAVAQDHRRRGIARRLLQHGLQAFHQAGIDKCHLLVFRSNGEGLDFWRRVGAEERVSIALFSMMTD